MYTLFSSNGYKVSILKSRKKTLLKKLGFSSMKTKEEELFVTEYFIPISHKVSNTVVSQWMS